MGALQVTLGLYASVLPFAILAAWVAVSLWDIAQRGDVGRGFALGWSLAVVVVPAVGAAAYLLSVGRLPRFKAVIFVAGGVVAYLLVVAITGMLGGAR